jgi:hypothetical protein
MGFLQPSPPPFDLERCKELPYLARLKANCATGGPSRSSSLVTIAHELAAGARGDATEENAAGRSDADAERERLEGRGGSTARPVRADDRRLAQCKKGLFFSAGRSAAEELGAGFSWRRPGYRPSRSPGVSQTVSCGLRFKTSIRPRPTAGRGPAGSIDGSASP